MKPLLLILLLSLTCRLNAWQQLTPPKTNNEFSRKQAALLGLHGSYKKISIGKKEKLIVETRFDAKSDFETTVILGSDSRKIEIFVYNYPGYHQLNRKGNITELRIKTEKKNSSSFYDRPRHYDSSIMLNTDKNRYFEELKWQGESIYYIEINLRIE
ncbi:MULTISPECIES: hypothetical protein [unclassified Lentimonas]|uniref:hypothetical protein n=1 Tax=unclassified Lentimonas TaxID=2630993 RepID=UPI0013297471|nr:MULTISPECIES: hypothetical protein [unclassified Lentimonas]CAA6678641.1 Unannotated [Lentimonas sp. CC4]CAA6683627.1 Unannotated [Lentimonas sp. CC6]CAA7074527.1 Unannotated [Lentimonas sp. CC4]CAA7169141.1 Unannotated [Lentimonas sp. CC21]CAA7180456.1 Unannotated [Lentimonas sp. CC8]